MSGTGVDVSHVLAGFMRAVVNTCITGLHNAAVALQHYHAPSWAFTCWLIMWWSKQLWRSRSLRGTMKLRFFAGKLGQVVWSHAFQFCAKVLSGICMAVGLANAKSAMLITLIFETFAIILLFPLPTPAIPALPDWALHRRKARTPVSSHLGVSLEKEPKVVGRRQ